MIEEKFGDLYARDSGLRDKLIAERDIVLTYALHGLVESGMMDDLAFKGGTCLRKITFGSSGRFSEDLDFTMDTDGSEDDVLVRLIEAFNREHYGIGSTCSEYYKTEDDRSFGAEVLYGHAWNDAGRFRLQVSLRERPTLPVVARPMQPQAYFRYLEFAPFPIRSLQDIEMIAEKVRATYQRAKVRDLYDLYRFATVPFDGDLLRRLVVLKLWQVRDPFIPEEFFSKLRGSNYDWDDLRRLVRPAERIEPGEVLSTIEARFASLRGLSELEQQVVADAKGGRNRPLGERLQEEVRGRFAEMSRR
jgi:predicted nucleotidyltransferase component of viral defense system